MLITFSASGIVILKCAATETLHPCARLQWYAVQKDSSTINLIFIVLNFKMPCKSTYVDKMIYKTGRSQAQGPSLLIANSKATTLVMYMTPTETGGFWNVTHSLLTQLQQHGQTDHSLETGICNCRRLCSESVRQSLTQAAVELSTQQCTLACSCHIDEGAVGTCCLSASLVSQLNR